MALFIVGGLGEALALSTPFVPRAVPVAALIREGCRLLDKALKGEGRWKKRAEEMKADAARYNSLSEEERLIEREADVTGRTVEEVRSFYQRSGARPSEFMATDFSDPRPRP